MSNERIPGGTGLDVELRSLAGHLAMPEPDTRTVDAVMARLDHEVRTAPGLVRRAREHLESVGGLLRKRWRTVGVAIAATVALLLVVTPAGAKVREWLGFGAVVIEQQQPARAGGAVSSRTLATPETTPGAVVTMSLEQAKVAVTFPIKVPAGLAEPTGVSVSADGRVVSMQWPDGPSGAVRLDQIDGALSPYFVKKYYQDVVFTSVNGAEALWLPQPHPIMVLNPDGSERAESARQSGPSLVWQNGNVTLRLEGVDEQTAAVVIAESLPN